MANKTACYSVYQWDIAPFFGETTYICVKTESNTGRTCHETLSPHCLVF